MTGFERPGWPLRLAPCAGLLAVLACGGEPTQPPSILDPDLSERDLRRALGVPDGAERVLVLSQSSHLDIDWKSTFDQYYEERVETIFEDAIAVLTAEPDSFYSVAEMAFLSKHLEGHDAAPWRAHAGTGHVRVVGGALTTPDTLLPTAEALTRDYLLGSIVAEEQLGARPRAAWLPDSFGHSPTVPDLLAAAGFDAVGFGRADGGRHTYEVLVDGLDPIAPGVVTTASVLRDMGTADFVWRGPGGGDVLAHYMPVSEYCQGDTIDLAGFAIGGDRLGVERDDDPMFVMDKIAQYVDELTPYVLTPYLFVPVGCDFQPPRPLLVQYAAWWNERRYPDTGVWVATATFEDYMRLVSFHRDALPVLERDIVPVWTGFYSTRPRIKRAARAAAESLAGVEPFLALIDAESDTLAAAWRSVALANHHDWITGTAKDDVVADEQLPLLVEASSVAEDAWSRTLVALSARVGTQAAGAGAVVVVVNPGPRDHSAIVTVPMEEGTGPLLATAGGASYPAQRVAEGQVAFLAGDVPAFGWRTFSVQAGSGATAPVAATVDTEVATLVTGALEARFARDADGWALASLAVDGEPLLGGASLEWIVYSDTGGLYRIGSERADCSADEFAEIAVVRMTSLSLVESGPARAVLRGAATVDGIDVVVDFVAAAGADRLALRVTGAAPTDRTIMLRARPAGDELAMGVAGGAVSRPLAHRYTPSLWPAVTWVARGPLAVHLTNATGVYGGPEGTLEWVVFRNATSEGSCDNLGPSGTDDAEQTLEYSLGRRDPAAGGASELAASMQLARPMRATTVDRHAGDLPDTGRLITVDGASVVATALKPASRGSGLVLHLVRPGAGDADLALRPGVLPWSTVTRPDLLERDDVAVGDVGADGITVPISAALTALRLTP